MTWEENNNKAYRGMRSGKLTHGTKPQKAVLQFTKEGIFVKEFVSTREASRQTEINQGNLSSCCIGRSGYSHSGGFVWKFKGAKR